MNYAVIYALIGYLSGSVLFARLAEAIFDREDIIDESDDGNPGTANAFKYGGFVCGVFTLAGDLLKGFIPVCRFMCRAEGMPPLAVAAVIAAPVIGHAFPLFFGFRGGKGIAVSFGCLLGLAPAWQPVLVLAAFFLLFTLVLKVTPHFQRTIVTYLCSAAVMIMAYGVCGITLGFIAMTSVVCLRMHMSREKREKMRVELAWKH